MSTYAQARSLLVISRRCRDVAGHRSLGFPVFAKGTSTGADVFYMYLPSKRASCYQTLPGKKISPPSL
jgi:hypothetical protein